MQLLVHKPGPAVLHGGLPEATKSRSQNGHLSRDYSFSSPHISHLSAGSCSPFLTGPFHSKIWLQALSTLLSPGKLFVFLNRSPSFCIVVGSILGSWALHMPKVEYLGVLSRSAFFLHISSWRPFVDARVELHLFSLWSVLLGCCSYFDNLLHNGKI